MARGKRPLDFGMAEALAFGTLLKQGTPVRLSGQDSKRGTFNQRHAALIDIENEQEFIPLQHVTPGQAFFEAYNSTLSEASVLGFEYGFSRDYPEALVFGKRNSAISPMARRSSSISSSQPAKTNGICSQGRPAAAARL